MGASENLRLCRAFLAHALAVVLAALTAFVLLEANIYSTTLWLGFHVDVSVGEATIGYVASIFVVPLTALLWFALASRGVLPKAWRWVVALAAAICAASHLIVTVLLATLSDGHLAILHTPFWAIIGGIYGAAYWLIRRPDRDAPNPPTSAP